MHGCISCLCIAEQTEETKREEKVMTRKIQCCVTALCLLLTAVLGFGIPATVSAAEADDFEIMYERCYEQTIGVKPGENTGYDEFLH